MFKKIQVTYLKNKTKAENEIIAEIASMNGLKYKEGFNSPFEQQEQDSNKSPIEKLYQFIDKEKDKEPFSGYSDYN